MTASGGSSCAPGTPPNRCGCRRMPCSSASAAPPHRRRGGERAGHQHRRVPGDRRRCRRCSGRQLATAQEPLPLETNRPGVFAAGDVRYGSVKRCAAAIGEGSMAVALVHRWLAEVGGD